MKKVIYKLINKLGYSIENKSHRKLEQEKSLERFRSLEKFNLIVLAKNYVLNLDSKFENLNISNLNDGFLVSFLDYKIYIESLEEFNILNEIFVNHDYNFLTNDKSVIIDIGTNIGITSLFFSAQNYVKEIYAYEPIIDTYKQAEFNFQMNQDISKVKSFKNIGLGKDNREEFFLFDKNTKGNTGIRGKMSQSYANSSNAEERKVQICNASNELKKIFEGLNGEKVIVKMDCEGAEYEIIENLFESGLLNRIDVFLIEWHDKGSRLLEDILLDSGFGCFSLNLNKVSGMIYAYRT